MEVAAQLLLVPFLLAGLLYPGLGKKYGEDASLWLLGRVPALLATSVPAAAEVMRAIESCTATPRVP